MRRYLRSRGINRDLKLAQKCAAESTALSTGTSARIRGKNDPKSRLAIPNLFCLIWQQFQSLKMVISPDFSDNFFSGRRRLKKRSEKTEVARSKRRHRKGGGQATTKKRSPLHRMWNRGRARSAKVHACGAQRNREFQEISRECEVIK